ncbi:MAG TPA: YfhO family protein, partial [Thermoanaerobaculia bacterium]|nr:YfhO family protein [Thermoanaerobaculia bacterium]
ALRLAAAAPDGRLSALAGARPRVWAWGRAEIDPGLGRFRARLAAQDPSASEVPWVDASGAPTGGGGPASAVLRSRTSGSMAIDVSAPAAAWLFVAEGYDRGWRASVDGIAAPVYRASGVFCAVPLAAGARHVVLRYRPASLLAGAVLSALGLVLLAAAARRGARGSGSGLPEP